MKLLRWLAIMGSMTSSGFAVERLVWLKPDAAGSPPLLAAVFPESGKEVLVRVPGEGPGVRLPEGTPAIRWAGFLPAKLASHAGGLVAVGSFGDRPVVEDWEIPADTAMADQPLPWPAGVSLQSGIPWRGFGEEERLTLTQGTGALSLVAKAGSKPAGVSTRASGRLPAREWCPQPRLALEWRAQGKWRLAADFGEPGLDPVVLAELAGEGAREIELAALPPDRPFRWVLLAPDLAAELKIDRFTLHAAGSGAPLAPLARWDWSQQPSKWPAHAPVWKELAVAYPHELRALAGRPLRQGGRRMVAVEGDPAMILPSERGKVTARVAALAGLPIASRPDALQFDIEPYLLPGYPLDPAGWNREWLETYRAIRAASRGLPVDVVLPWWLLDDPVHAEFLRQLPSVSDGVVVMNYRTDPAAALQSAAAWMEWGAKAGRPVAIAMEFGPLPTQQAQRFVPAAKGELWFVDFPGGGTVALLLEQPALPPTGARAFEAKGNPESRLPDGVTFHRDPPKARALLRALRELSPSVPDQSRPVYLHEPPAGFPVESLLSPQRE